jgi:hypothetical protein
VKEKTMGLPVGMGILGWEKERPLLGWETQQLGSGTQQLGWEAQQWEKEAQQWGKERPKQGQAQGQEMVIVLVLEH